jgi:hypothetical protein
VRCSNAELRILLGIPSAGTPAAPFIESLAKIELPVSAEQFARCVITGNYIPAQRDLIVERALESGVDILVMCDDDMVLPVGAVTALCSTLAANPRAAVAGALYYSRDGFRPMAVDKWNEHDTRTAVIPAFDREPVAVHGVGFGCVALRVSALRDLMPPYFSAHVFVERQAGRVRICDEDYLFCAKLRRANWLVLLDPSVRCGHYNRQLQRAMPDVWEGPDVTSQARIAALVDGRPTLIPARDIPASTPEAHVQADLQYIVVP